jgi:hypothetical protein
VPNRPLHVPGIAPLLPRGANDSRAVPVENSLPIRTSGPPSGIPAG